MRSIRFYKFGPPVEVLKLEERPLPKPGPGEVRIRLTHRTINPSDLLTVTGEYGRLPPLPATPGNEGVGRIEALGEGVDRWEVGQRVIPRGSSGTWQEYTLAKATLLIPVHEDVSDQAAAQFIVNPVTAWVMLTQELGLRDGEWLLQNAAGSTLGRILVQMAQWKGYKTINLVRRREQVQELLDLGADAVISTQDEDVVAQVMALTGGKGADGALDAVGGETNSLVLRCLRPGRTLLVYGILSREPACIDTGEMLFRGLSMRGFWLSHWLRATPHEEVNSVFSELMQLMADGKIIPPVEAEYDLAKIHAAVRHAERKGNRGKVILTG